MVLVKKGLKIVQSTKKQPHKNSLTAEQAKINTRVRIYNSDAKEDYKYFYKKTGKIIKINDTKIRPYLVQLDVPIEPEEHNIEDIDLLEFEYFDLDELRTIGTRRQRKIS